MSDDAETMLAPSYFAAFGSPNCSRWGKSELEWLALAYVQALANSGDTWRKLSREQTYKFLSDKQKQFMHEMLNDDFYQVWFNTVSRQITDAKGALGVGGSWRKP